MIELSLKNVHLKVDRSHLIIKFWNYNIQLTHPINHPCKFVCTISN